MTVPTKAEKKFYANATVKQKSDAVLFHKLWAKEMPNVKLTRIAKNDPGWTYMMKYGVRHDGLINAGLIGGGMEGKDIPDIIKKIKISMPARAIDAVFSEEVERLPSDWKIKEDTKHFFVFHYNWISYCKDYNENDKHYTSEEWNEICRKANESVFTKFFNFLRK